MSEEWDALIRKVERSEKRINCLEACAPLSGVWYATLSGTSTQAEKVLYAASRGRVARISYYLITSSSVTVMVTLNGQTRTFSHAAGNPCMMIMLPLSQGSNVLRVGITSGASGVSSGCVSAEQLNTPS